MKKVLFALSVVGLTAMVSCKDTKKEVDIETKSTDTTETTTSAPVETKTETTTSVTVPNFSNDEVQKFANEYAEYMEDVMTAAKSNDPAKIKELEAKATEWGNKNSDAMSKMTAEDIQKWTEFTASLAKAYGPK